MREPAHGNKFSGIYFYPPKVLSLLFFLNIYVFIIYDREREREREAETQEEGDAGSMPGA